MSKCKTCSTHHSQQSTQSGRRHVYLAPYNPFSPTYPSQIQLILYICKTKSLFKNCLRTWFLVTHCRKLFCIRKNIGLFRIQLLDIFVGEKKSNEKEQSWKYYPPRLKTIQQSYRNQNSIILTQKHTRRSMEQYREQRNKPTRLSDFTFTFHFHALEKEMATHSSVLAWRLPGMGKPSGLPSVASHRVGHEWSDLVVVVVCMVN